MSQPTTERASWIPRPVAPSQGPETASVAPSVPAPRPSRPGSGNRVSGLPSPARVVGPGRLERRYMERVEGLSEQLDEVSVRATALERQLETSTRLERGCQALINRMEERAGEDRLERQALEQREKRLILLLGGLQRENEMLREQLALGGPGRPELGTGATAAAPSEDAPRVRAPGGAPGCVPGSVPGRSGRRAAGGKQRPRAGWLGRLFGSR